MSEVLSKSDFQSTAAQTAPIERVPVPELGAGKVAIIRGMSGTERDKYQASLLLQGKRGGSRVDMTDVSAKLVARCLIHESGERMFTDAEVSTVGAIRGDVLKRLYDVAAKLSGITDEEIDELGKSSANPIGTSSSSVSHGSSSDLSA